MGRVDQRVILQHTDDNDLLRQQTRELSNKEILSVEIQDLIIEMRDIIHAAPGVGLAATQIGLPLRLAVIEDSEERLKTMDAAILADRHRQPVLFHAIINPQIIQYSDEQKYYFEGCLSVKSGVRIIPRSESVVVRYLNEKAEMQEIEAKGWYARILQHEIDHLNGVLNIDRGDSRTEVNFDDYKNKWLYASSPEIYQFYCQHCAIK